MDEPRSLDADEGCHILSKIKNAERAKYGWGFTVTQWLAPKVGPFCVEFACSPVHAWVFFQKHAS